MHFDEVYHARTATEFLQFWRYGIPHSIYEYTHPHMAKYLIAEGITFFGDNRVVDERELGAPVKAAAIEQRWAPAGEDAVTRNGDRVYVATGTTLACTTSRAGAGRHDERPRTRPRRRPRQP